MGEVGATLFKILESCISVYGDDINSARRHGFKPTDNIEIVHICFPWSANFVSSVIKYYHKYRPLLVVIHSTVKPGTTDKIQRRLPQTAVVFSPIRGVHANMERDLRRYTKFYASYSDKRLNLFLQRFGSAGIKLEPYSDPLALEYAKILCDTTYYGWLIIYAQRTKMICDEKGIDYDELWRFAEEIHRFLANRPKMFPGSGIGGHCVLPNLELLDDGFFKIIKRQDQKYRKHLKDSLDGSKSSSDTSTKSAR